MHMTNEEYIKSYSGKEFKDCIERFFIKNELAPYIDWERWLSNERCAYFFKGVKATYVQKDGSKVLCTVVSKKEIMGEEACDIILIINGRYYLMTVLEENIIWQDI